MLKKHLYKLIAALLTLSVLAMANEPAQDQASTENAGYTHVPVNISFVPNVGTGGLAGGIINYAGTNSSAGSALAAAGRSSPAWP